MDDVMIRLTSNPKWKEELKKTCRINKVSPSIATYLNPDKLKNSFKCFNNSSSTFIDPHKWRQKQLKNCHWCAMAISQVFSKRIADFDEEEWNLLFTFFPDKESQMVKYQVLKLIHQKGASSLWSRDEESIFQQTMKTQGQQTNKWIDKAFQLFKTSNGKYLRTGKQCREKWINSLNPCNNKTQWSQAQDIRLAQLILKRGRKWSALAKELDNNRTEHMVKKRYKTIVSHLRKVYTQLTDENSLLEKLIENSPPDSDLLRSEKDNQVNQTNQSSTPLEKNEIRQDDEKETEEMKRKALIAEIQGYFPLEKELSHPNFDDAQVFSPFMTNSPLHLSQAFQNANYLLFNGEFVSDPLFQERKQSSD